MKISPNYKSILILYASLIRIIGIKYPEFHRNIHTKHLEYSYYTVKPCAMTLGHNLEHSTTH